MKFLAIIFACYILLLPAFPCMDKDECADNYKTELPGSLPDHTNHQHENGACNVFCSCACCAHIFVHGFQLEHNSSINPEILQQQHCFYVNISLSSDYFGNIWQPPKFS